MKRLTERDAYWYGEEFWTSAREPDEEEIDEIYFKLKKSVYSAINAILLTINPMTISRKISLRCERGLRNNVAKANDV